MDVGAGVAIAGLIVFVLLIAGGFFAGAVIQKHRGWPIK
jgi:hypothetical protein